MMAGARMGRSRARDSTCEVGVRDRNKVRLFIRIRKSYCSYIAPPRQTPARKSHSTDTHRSKGLCLQRSKPIASDAYHAIALK